MFWNILIIYIAKMLITALDFYLLPNTFLPDRFPLHIALVNIEK